MNFSWQAMCGAAILEKDPDKRPERLAAAQKIIIQRLQELSGADEGEPEVRALREALNSIYGAWPQQRFRAGELADEEDAHGNERKWMRIAAGVCAALIMAVAMGWMIQKRSEANKVQRIGALRARAETSTSPSIIAERLGEPPAGAASSSESLSPDSHSDAPARTATVTAAAGARKTNASHPGTATMNGSAGIVSDRAARAVDEVQTPPPTIGNESLHPAVSADRSAESTEATQTAVSPTEPRDEIQSAPLTAPLAAPTEQQSTPSDATAAKEKSQAAGARALAALQTPGMRQGSVSVDASRYPSIRVPPELKIEAAQSGASLQIGEAVSRVEPVYPEDAKREGIEGTVELRATVGKDGTVQNVEIVSGPPLLAAAAVNAVRQWQYRPTLIGDQGVQVVRDITVVFRLRDAAAVN
ncbi:MAG TPA: TonB family protein [Candidatus Acidoferrales bacterium]|nr:TonB family protein [Candidatus Acidoferrales bacterium]